MRKRQFFATITLCALLVAGLILYMLTLKEGDDSAGQVFPVVINEVMTSNKGSVSDGMGNFPDTPDLLLGSIAELRSPV